MTSRLRISMLLLSLAAALLPAGCGGEVSKGDYASDLRTTMDDLEAAYGQAGAALEADTGTGTTRTVAQVVAELRVAQVALRDAGNRLDEIEPPADLADTHEELVAGVRDMADAVDLLVDAQERAEQDPKTAGRLAREFASDDSFERVQAAAARLADAGVDAGL